MDTLDKIKGGNEQVSNEKFYIPLSEPILSSTDDNQSHAMTHKWLNQGQNPPRIPEFYTLTKVHKPVPVGRPIVSGSGGPTERISSFVDSLLQPIAKKQESYIKDTTHFISFIENTRIPDETIFATLDVCYFTVISLEKKGLKLFANTMKSIISLNHPSPLQLLGNS